VLTIRGIENYPNNSIKIYNRWGVLVYSTRAYNTQGNVFDGTSQGRVTVDKENKLPVGTYFYILEYENDGGKQQTLSGYLYLNK
jgi:gliding motility-associated-like protein